MSGRNSIAAYLMLIALAVLGAWLNGQFQDDVTDASLLRLMAGLVIMVGALIGIVLLIRRGLRPMGQRELAAWGVVRSGGRRSYLRAAILRGLVFGLFCISWPLARDLRRGESLAPVIDSLWVYVAVFLVGVFAAVYAAVRTWDAREKDYEASGGSAARPNDGPHPNADTQR
jgi:hypothetical protein